MGSLREVKNPLSLLKAFSLVAKEETEVDLAYVGDGPLREELEAEIESLGLKSRVHLAGVRLPASPYFGGFDMFVQPSFSEACSLALLEAMYRGVPVIVSSGGGGPELVEDKNSGLVVPVNDEEALSSAILATLANAEEVSKRITAARHRVETEFDFASMLSAYEEIYESCL